MSGFEFHGRNIADSRPVVHVPPGASREPYSNGLAGKSLQSRLSELVYITSAWLLTVAVCFVHLSGLCVFCEVHNSCMSIVIHYIAIRFPLLTVIYTGL